MKNLTALVLAAGLATVAHGAAQGAVRPGDAPESRDSRRTIVVAQGATPSGGRAGKAAARDQIRAEGKAFLAENAKAEGVVTRPSGLQYRVLSDGKGATPGPHDTVVVKYRGTLIDGSEFGSSGAADKTETFPMDRLVPGLAEALQLMKPGSHWTVYIPAALAFGERGPLEDRVVIYDLTLVSVEPKK